MITCEPHRVRMPELSSLSSQNGLSTKTQFIRTACRYIIRRVRSLTSDQSGRCCLKLKIRQQDIGITSEKRQSLAVVVLGLFRQVGDRLRFQLKLAGELFEQRPALPYAVEAPADEHFGTRHGTCKRMTLTASAGAGHSNSRAVVNPPSSGAIRCSLRLITPGLHDNQCRKSETIPGCFGHEFPTPELGMKSRWPSRLPVRRSPP